MTHFPSARLSRQELYSYGFKEGEPWAQDRRALESALQAMDKLERDIQENYIYSRPPPMLNPYTSAAATPRHMSRSTSGNYFSPGRYPTPDIRMARSDASDYSPEISGASPYSGRGYEYREHTNIHVSPQSGWHPPPPPPNFTRSSSGSGIPQEFQEYPQQYYPSSSSRISPSTSSSWNSRAAQESVPQYSPNSSKYYGPRVSSAGTSSRSAVGAPAQQFSPSQMQLVAYNDAGRSAHPDDSDDQHSYTSETPPQWPMDATQGTAMSERVMSDTSSQGIYSEDSALSDVTRSSGYVESYDVASHEDYRGDYRDSEEDHEYMSDDVASNEGEYYSSSDEPVEYDGDGEDIYSDEGSDSYYDDGASYDDSD